jgi:hypothetical protein
MNERETGMERCAQGCRHRLQTLPGERWMLQERESRLDVCGVEAEDLVPETTLRGSDLGPKDTWFHRVDDDRNAS